ncbi:hypothetical protein [Mangrovibacter phragmitis]|uniref:hypothetical protein n=1 Tax=Mangrovibacter phragmitis TaxID=1691903 RepID=UPI0012E90EAC|nr:hypothetical protein [Mangrovibacter phragmitis]
MKWIAEVTELVPGSHYKVNYFDEAGTPIGGFEFAASSMDEAEQLIREANINARKEQ